MSSTLTGPRSWINTRFVCASACVSLGQSHFLQFGNRERLLRSPEKGGVLLASWMSSDGCDPLTQ